MIKVITYGTYDLLHYGHIKLLERAKALGDYLIVGITADDFDKTRGKINVQQSLMERIESVRATGIANEIIVEEYEGQKIDDIKRYDIDIFTVGSDWVGKFDYLKEYCQVTYLLRTEGVSSSELRTDKRALRLGLVGESNIVGKFINESKFVNGLIPSGIFTIDVDSVKSFLNSGICVFDTYEGLLKNVDAVYLVSSPSKHYYQVLTAIKKGKHVLCESPIALKSDQCRELYELAKERNSVLMESTKTAYSTAFHRMMLLVKSGIIGNVVSVDATCTSLKNVNVNDIEQMKRTWNSITAWGPTGMLPIFKLFGTDYIDKKIITFVSNRKYRYDLFTKIDFVYPNAVASVKIGQGVKSEGELIISGTMGYVYVPAPWWKTDYFEIRYENPVDNKRFFYQLDGEGIRYELVSLVRSIESKHSEAKISEDVSIATAHVIEDFYNDVDTLIFYKN